MTTTDMMNGRLDPMTPRTPEMAIIGLGRMGGGTIKVVAALRNQFGGHAVERA